VGGKYTYQKVNEKLAPNLAAKVLQLISGFLFLVGKPLFLFSLLSLTVILNLLNITGRYSKIIIRAINKVRSLINSLGIRKKSGLIFSASRERLKTRFNSFQKLLGNIRRKGNENFLNYAEKTGEILWKAEVFLIALKKVLAKFLAYARSRVQPKRIIRLYFLKLRLVFLTLTKDFPKPKFPKFSLLRILSILSLFIFLA
jgi:hypothetical protein